MLTNVYLDFFSKSNDTKITHLNNSVITFPFFATPKVNIDLSSFSRGVYFVNVFCKEGTLVRKLVKQ
ncbi:MAG: T9SS type A sorting domain-containing protein [Bacteroidota bacterium]